MAAQKIHKVIVTDLMKKKSYKRKRGPVQAKKVTYDGIKFASGLERYMYMALKKAKIKAKYEGETYEVVSGFDFINPSHERTANGLSLIHISEPTRRS